METQITKKAFIDHGACNRNAGLSLRSCSLLLVALFILLYNLAHLLTDNVFSTTASFVLLASVFAIAAALFPGTKARFLWRDLSWFLILIPLLISGARGSIDIPLIGDCLMYGCSGILIILSAGELKDYDPAVRILSIGAIIYLCTIYIQWIRPDWFESLFVGRYNETKRFIFDSAMQGGYHIGAASTPSGDATYCLICFSITLCFFKRGTFSKRLWDCAVLVFVLVAYLLIARRAATLSLGVCCMVYYIFTGNHKRRGYRILFVILLGLLACAILFALLPYLSDIPLFARVAQTVRLLSRGDDATSGRASLYAKAIGMFRENRWFGAGWKQYLLVGENYAHNVYLQLLAEAGILGLWCFLIPMLMWYGRTVKNYSALMKNRGAFQMEASVYAGLALFLQTDFLFMSFFDNGIYTPMQLWLYVFSCMITQSVSSGIRSLHSDVLSVPGE